jgi:hypothetical protein
MRYFYGRPFRGGYEMTELIMATIVAFGLPYAAISGGHVSVDILSRWLDRPACAGSPCWSILRARHCSLRRLAQRPACDSGMRFGDMPNMMRIPKFPSSSPSRSPPGCSPRPAPGSCQGPAPQDFDTNRKAMTPTMAGLVGLVALFVLLALRMPIGLAMMAVGAAGIAVLNSPAAAMNVMGQFPYSYSAVFTLSVIPLFVLMGSFASISGMGTDLYRTAYTWIGHRRGGLAAATILACAGFAALSGSSIAAAATMGKVALPEMERYKYDNRLATGSIAAGGTLGILIPPSTVLIVYALLTEQSVGRLFLAGFLPGVLLTLLFVITVFIIAILRPDAGPPGEKPPLSSASRCCCIPARCCSSC